MRILHKWLVCCVWPLLLHTVAAGQAPRPVPVIFDTDMGNDVDDVLALAMLYTASITCCYSMKIK